MQGSYIALYKVVTAGDYHAIHISGSGQAQYTNHSRTYEILTHKQDDLAPQVVTDLFALLVETGFFDLEEEYQLPPPSADEPELDFEDIYYWVEVVNDQQKSVLSHELASPPELQAIIQKLFDVARQLPDVQEEGTFLLAVDYGLLPYLRQEAGMRSLELDAQGAKEYPPLEEALLSPGKLVPVEDSSIVGQFYGPETHMMEVVFENRQFVVLLLTQT